jgi:hypothetical protein
MSSSSSKGTRVLPTKKNTQNENVIKTKPRAKIIRTRSNTRRSSAQKDSQVNLKITQKSSIEDTREPTVKETNKAGDDKASQQKKKKSANANEKSTMNKKHCSSEITHNLEDNLSIGDRIGSKRKQKRSDTENVKRPKEPVKVVITKTKLTEEEKQQRDYDRSLKNFKQVKADPEKHIPYRVGNNFSRRINRCIKNFGKENGLNADEVVKQYKNGDLIFIDIPYRCKFVVAEQRLKNPETIDKTRKIDDKQSNLKKNKNSSDDDAKCDDKESRIIKFDNQSKMISVDLSDKIISTLETNGTRLHTIRFNDDELRKLSKFKNEIFGLENTQVAKSK